MRGICRGRPLLAVLLLTAAVSTSPVDGRGPAPLTVIVVNDMHCSSCAKKIAGRLYRVPGVARVATSLKQNRAFVTAQQSREPSPRALWEAVEQAGFQPVEMSGPGGTFREKPAS